MFRRPGQILPLERRILETVLASQPVHGFGLAKDLADSAGDKRLVAHGTLYKALDRMRLAGLLEAEWEDSDAASASGRPRRRLYRVTGVGVAALTASESGPGNWAESTA